MEQSRLREPKTKRLVPRELQNRLESPVRLPTKIVPGDHLSSVLHNAALHNALSDGDEPR